MGFYLVNNELDSKISAIKRSIRLAMNGVVADSMAEKGLKYKQNFGVELPALRMIAENYSANQDLANRLWLLGWRETMILSLLLEPAEKLSIEKAVKRAQEAPHLEIIQLLAIILFRNIQTPEKLCMRLLEQNEVNCKIAGYLLALQVYKMLDNESVKYVLSNAFVDAETTDFQLSNAVSKCLSRFCRIDKQTREIIINGTRGFGTDKNPLKNKMLSELNQEIEYIQQII
jgi:hypothetical protein